MSSFALRAGRRDVLGRLLAAAAGAGALGEVASSAHPDHVLMAVCREFTELEDRADSLFSGGSSPIADEDARDRARAPLEARQAELLGQLSTMRAATLDGVLARARMIARWEPGLVLDPGAGAPWDMRMIAGMLGDLVELGRDG